MLTNLPFLNEVKPTARETPLEVSRKAAAKWADGAKTETESRVLTAFRTNGVFYSAASLAAFLKLDAGAVRDAMNELIARQLVRFGSDQLGTGGYRAYEKTTGFNIK